MILVINSILLVGVTIALACLIANEINLERIIHLGLKGINHELDRRRLRKEIKKYTMAVKVKMSLPEKIELYLIDKSNIRHYLPFFNFYFLCFIIVSIFVLTFGYVFKILLFVPSAAAVCFLFSLIPVFILDIMGRYNSEKIRRKLADFISVLNRWCAVKEDIFYAFEKSVESGIGEPLRTFIKDMVIQVNCGIEPLEALDILQMKVDNAQFKDFLINIKQNIKHRGDIRKLLSNLEGQFYKIEEEYNRRKISTYKDRLLIYFIMFSVLFIGYFFLKSTPKIEDFYLNTLAGKSLLMVFCFLYACGFYMTLKITSFKH
ncbi:MAG TPA: hypothetical protein GXX14_10945 [Clostridiaceae bacterium]|nr:hypothetical protein [Clostridiaceae bacterium]